MQLVILDNDENTEFKPFSVIISIDTMGDFADLVKRFSLTSKEVNMYCTPRRDNPSGQAKSVHLISIWRLLESKFKIFEKTYPTD